MIICLRIMYIFIIYTNMKARRYSSVGAAATNIVLVQEDRIIYVMVLVAEVILAALRTSLA